MRFPHLPISTLTSDGRVTGVRVYRASTFISRAVGLLFARPLRRGEGLWISPCGSLHTFGMRYGIDIVFLDGKGRVIARRAHLKPRRVALCRGAKCVLELPAGASSDEVFRPGRSLRLEPA